MSNSDSGQGGIFPKIDVYIQNTGFDAGAQQDICGNTTDPFTLVDGSVWSSGHQYCIQIATAHELLHALGAGHEADRTDVTIPGGICPPPVNDPDAIGYGPFDQYSIGAQSYCSRSTARASTTDLAWLHDTYGMGGTVLGSTLRSNDWIWWIEGNPQEFWGDVWYGAIPSLLTAFPSPPTPGLEVATTNLNSSGTYTPIAGDFDGDEISDILGSTAGHMWWGTDRTGFNQQAYMYPVSAGFTPISGDFDGDSRGDVFWYKPGTGADAVWWGTGNRSSAFSGVLQTVNGANYQPFAADFDGDGASDIFWYDPTGYSRIWWGIYGTKGFYHSPLIYWVASGARPVAGDFDRDGYTDIWWLRQVGTDDLWWSNGSNRTFSPQQITAPLYNTATVAFGGKFTRQSSGNVFFDTSGSFDQIWEGQTNRTFVAIPVSHRSAFLPIVGDFDGDTVDDIYWYIAGDAP
ncbi:MAG: VCBS repeat-containing protein [Polyangiaceae bacterium]|nr:VCBS repeat-containing protein [Polyangiaceae bacterium]